MTARFVLLFSAVLIALGCGGTMGSMMSGLTSQGTTVSLTSADIFPSLNATQQATVDPFAGTPVTYQQLGIEQVDSFNAQAATLYGRVLATQQIVDTATEWRSNPNMSVQGFNSLQDLAAVAQEVTTSAPSNVTSLISEGQNLVTNITDIAASNPLLVPAATSEIQQSIQRLNDTQQALQGLVPAVSGLVTGSK